MADGRSFSIAGLWEEWNSPDSELLHTCSILTTEASPGVAAIHHRMPVILGADAQFSWLETDPEDRTQLQSLLKPYPRDDLYPHPVSTQMNAATWDDPNCIEPILN